MRPPSSDVFVQVASRSCLAAWRCLLRDCYLHSRASGCRLGVVADIGQTANSSVTYQQLVADKPDVSAPRACLHGLTGRTPAQSAWRGPIPASTC